MKTKVFFFSCLFITSSCFCWFYKPNVFYNKEVGVIQDICESQRYYATRAGVGGIDKIYEVIINNNKYEIYADNNQLKKYRVVEFVNHKAIVRYNQVIGSNYPRVVTLVVDNKDIITNDIELSWWFLGLFLLLASGSWLVWRFIKYWKSV